MKKIAVLLAAYNGTRWIGEQIASILQQENVDVTIYISVDLSTDGTHQLCKSLCGSNNRIIVLPYGERFGGAAANFYRLIKDVDFSEFDFISLADQDDIWNKDKLCTGIQYLAKYDAYSSNVDAFWENGKSIVIKKSQPQVEYDFLFEAAGPGCTYIINTRCALAFKEFIINNWSQVSKIDYHDWLFYAFARSYGYSWFIDPKAGMRYRQHENNQVGANHSLKAALKRLYLIKTKWYRCEVLKICKILSDKVDPPFKKALDSSIYFEKVRLLLYINKLRRKTNDRLFLAIAIIANIF